jgi:hypothetical protein
MDRENRESMEEIHLRILRVTEDLRMIQRELNCAAMQAPTDPELMEALADPPEMETIQVLKSALDQMRHFLWFYMQVVASDSEMGEKFRQTLRQDAPVPAPEMEQQFQSATDAIMLRYLADSKFRKPRVDRSSVATGALARPAKHPHNLAGTFPFPNLDKKIGRAEARPRSRRNHMKKRQLFSRTNSISFPISFQNRLPASTAARFRPSTRFPACAV